MPSNNSVRRRQTTGEATHTMIPKGTRVFSTASDWPAGGKPLGRRLDLTRLNYVAYERDRIVWAGAAGYWRWVFRDDLKGSA